MESKVTNTAGAGSAAHEMLAALRLLSVKGHVPGEQVGRWEAAIEGGEPEVSRIAAIRAVLDAFDWETGDRQYALEKIEQIAAGSRVASGTEPGGGAYLTPGDLATVLGALDVAADELRCRAGICNDCDVSPAGLCDTCEGRLARADDYDSLAAKLGGAL